MTVFSIDSAIILITIEFSRFCAAMQRYGRKLWFYSREFTTLKGIVWVLKPVMVSDTKALPVRFY